MQPTLRRYALLSLAAAVATIGLKTAAFLVTGSVGLLSDALESLVNIAAALAVRRGRSVPLFARADTSAQTIVHLLDYMSVDYPEFVKDGKVLDEAEFKEQQEFSGQIKLDGGARRDQLVTQANALRSAIDAKAPGADVSRLATDLRWQVIDAYQLAVAPKRAPDIARGKTLFAAQCAACHGVEGRGVEVHPRASLIKREQIEEGEHAAHEQQDPGEHLAVGDHRPEDRQLGEEAQDQASLEEADREILEILSQRLLQKEVVDEAELRELERVAPDLVGVDLATVDEVVAFFDVSNPTGPTYGATIKFNQPYGETFVVPEADITTVRRKGSAGCVSAVFLGHRRFLLQPRCQVRSGISRGYRNRV